MVDVNFGVDVRARIRLIPVPRLVLALCRRHSTSKLRAGWPVGLNCLTAN